MRISVVGLGKIGTPLTAVLANAGHDIVGVDVMPEPVDLLNRGLSPIDEPGLASWLERNHARVTATVDGAAAAAATDVTFIIVPTPSTEAGTFSSRFVREAIESCGRGLRGREDYHLVVVTSTVTPGSMDRDIRPVLESASGRRVGRSLGLCYNPEFIALGTVIRDLTQPNFVLIGESDPRAGNLLASLYGTVVAHPTPIRRMNFVNAELTKLAVNAYVTTKISFANMLSELCERIPGGDVDVVTSAAGFDARIGHSYFRGALGYGGPCFPRDNLALAAVASEHGVRTDIPTATDSLNRHQVDRMVRLVLAHAVEGRSRVGILGLSYKPDTSVVDESQGLLLANRLAILGRDVVVYDPRALTTASPHLTSSIRVAESVAACVDGADVLVIATPWSAFDAVTSCLARREGEPVTLIDCWRMLDRERSEAVARLVYPGVAPAPDGAISTASDGRTACSPTLTTEQTASL